MEYGAVKDTQKWMQDGLCRTDDPEMWYSKDKQQIRAAKQVCARCPVMATCRQYGLSHKETFGVWGGLDEKQRRSIRRSRLLS